MTKDSRLGVFELKNTFERLDLNIDDGNIEFIPSLKNKFRNNLFSKVSSQKIIDSFINYLKKHGKEKDVIWRIGCFKTEIHISFSKIFFKGDCVLATLKVYNYLKSCGYGQYLDELIINGVLEQLVKMECSLENAVTSYMIGKDCIENNTINEIEYENGGPFTNNKLWIERVRRLPKSTKYFNNVLIY